MDFRGFSLISNSLDKLGKTAAVIAAVSTVFSNLSFLFFPIWIMLFLESSWASDHHGLSVLFVCLPILLGIILGFISSIACTQVLQKVRANSKRILYMCVFNKEGDPSNFKLGAGVATSYIETASFCCRSIVSEIINEFSKFFSTIMFVISVVGFFHPKNLIFFLAWFLIFSLASVYLSKKDSAKVSDSVKSTAKVSSHIIDTFNNYELVRLSNEVDHEVEKLNTALEEESKVYNAALYEQEASSLVQKTMIVFMIAAFSYINLSYSGASIDNLKSFLPMIYILFFSSMQLESFGKNVTSFLEYRNKLSFLIEELEYPSTANSRKPTDSSLIGLNKNFTVELDNVDFHYLASSPIIKNCSMKLYSGERVVIAGASGAGKSTLVKLLRGTIQPVKGKIIIDSYNIRDCSEEFLLKIIYYIPQNCSILNRSLKENLLYGLHLNIDEKLLYKALDIFNLKHLLDRDQGLDTVLNEKGSNLSGGERQRIALARAYLASPKVLILDEATAAIDSESEDLIFHVLSEKFKDSLVITIAHRASSFFDADKVFFIQSGKVTLIGDIKDAHLHAGFSRLHGIKKH
ncbi:ABC transporter ATP-binding protein (plasmid) [Pseudomonas luteola]|uniref:ATP-binding cassette domain-containing protein n=1 Tax=Pseudomonas luteola TaxID=47886 RepID=UPI003DA0AC45